MRIRVRLFAMQRELAGRREVELELPEGASIETAWRALVGVHPALAPGALVVFDDYGHPDYPGVAEAVESLGATGSVRASMFLWRPA